MTESPTSPTAALGLGCATVFSLPTARERRAMLEFALANGLRHFDVAPMYGLGRAEPQLGAFLTAHAEQVRVATKFGIDPSAAGRLAGWVQGPMRRAMRRAPELRAQVKQSGESPHAGRVGRLLYRSEDYSPATARASLERSLRLLRRDRIELFLVHEPALAIDSVGDDLIAYLESARDAGLIETWGLAGDLSAIESDKMARFATAGAVALQHPYDIVRGLQGPAPNGGGQRIVFGLLSRGLPRCSAALDADPVLAARIAALAGTETADRATLAGLLVKDACAAAAGGTVLVSSTRPAHLRALITAAASFSDDERVAVDLLKRAVRDETEPA